MTAKRITLIALFVALLTVSAKITIPMVPVPMTLQTAVVLFFACYLGLPDSLIGTLIYIVMGLVGIPVFASGGGFSYVVQPSFGFTFGFLAACVVCGLTYKKSASISGTILSVAAGTAVVYVVGISYFLLLKAFYLGGAIDFWSILMKFWIVFIPSDVLKAAICVVALRRLAKYDMHGAQ